jgi:DNA polymerase-3 subunit epsilon
MYWLGIDFETTGLDATKDRITEVGAVLWDVEGMKPVRIISELVYDFNTGVPDVSPEITGLTGITSEMLEQFGANTAAVLQDVNDLSESADYFVAHNAPFDRAFYEEECARAKLAKAFPPYLVEESIIPWIDTVTDVDYRTTGSRSLSYLAADHGFVNPFSHRAVFDVLTMFNVISEYDPKQILEWQASPTVILRAMVQYSEKDLAKKLSYRWAPENKHWLKTIKEFNVDEELKLARETGFEVEFLK